MTDENQIVKGYTFRLDESIVKAIDYIAERETKTTKYRLDRSQILRKALYEYIERYYAMSPPTIEELEMGVVPIDYVVITPKIKD